MFETILHCHLVVVEITLGCWFEWHCHTASVISYHIHVVWLFYVAGCFFFIPDIHQNFNNSWSQSASDND